MRVYSGFCGSSDCVGNSQQIIFTVFAADGNSQPWRIGRDCGKANGRDQQSLFEEFFAGGKGRFRIGQRDTNDWAFGRAEPWIRGRVGVIQRADSTFFEQLSEQFAATVQPMSAIGFANQYIESSCCGSGDRGRQGGGEELAAAGVPQPFAEFRAACCESTKGSAGLTESSDADVHLRIELLQFTNAAAMFPEDAGAVGFINNKDCLEFTGDLIQCRQISDCTIHAVDGIGDDKHEFKLAAAALQSVVQSFELAAVVDEKLCSGAAAAIDQTGMVFAIAEDSVSGPGDGIQRSEIGGESGWKERNGLSVFPLGEELFETLLLG